MNILDYIDWRGDLTFKENEFNEVDNLVFSTLAYLKMDGLIKSDAGVSIAALDTLYEKAGYDQSHLVNNPQPLLKKAAASRRYCDVVVKAYVNKIDPKEKLQFAAAFFVIDKRLGYVSFRGTDNTIVGWREDCNISFLPYTPGQAEAALYLDRIGKEFDGDLIVGGHSKGGNFAIYGAAFCNKAVQRRIKRVYSNDGPGFNDEVASSAEYRAILPKTEKIIPDSSLVGILLTSKIERTIIRSDARGVMQHNPFTWRVIGTKFERADERTSSSLFMDETLTKWVGSLSTQNKQILVNSVFDALEASGATTLTEINQNKRVTYAAILKAASKIDAESKSDLMETIKKLFESGKETALSEAQKALPGKKET